MCKVTKTTGRAVPVAGDDIDTDRIIPARYLKEITFANMGKYAFHDERFDAQGGLKPHAFNEPRYEGAQILFANVNFGCGSSREHAPQALVGWGIKAVVAESLAEIFAGNCVMLGTPALTASKQDIAALQKLAHDHPETEFTVDLGTMTVSGGGLNVQVAMPETRRKALLEGTWDSTGLLMANAGLVKENAKRLPYMNAYA
jgi:3-isopropylmalate/(R)-2-methylmalate dehydratase small subunit